MQFFINVSDLILISSKSYYGLQNSESRLDNKTHKFARFYRQCKVPNTKLFYLLVSKYKVYEAQTKLFLTSISSTLLKQTL